MRLVHSHKCVEHHVKLKDKTHFFLVRHIFSFVSAICVTPQRSSACLIGHGLNIEFPGGNRKGNFGLQQFSSKTATHVTSRVFTRGAPTLFHQVPSLQDLFQTVKPEVILEFLKAGALYRLFFGFNSLFCTNNRIT